MIVESWSDVMLDELEDGEIAVLEERVLLFALVRRGSVGCRRGSKESLVG